MWKLGAGVSRRPGLLGNLVDVRRTFGYRQPGETGEQEAHHQSRAVKTAKNIHEINELWNRKAPLRDTDKTDKLVDHQKMPDIHVDSVHATEPPGSRAQARRAVVRADGARRGRPASGQESTLMSDRFQILN